MAEQSEVERLTEEAAKIKADLAAAVRLADQTENLLPKLRKKRDALCARIAPLDAELGRVSGAIAEIEIGTPTDYHLRKPKKTAEGA